VAYVKGEYNGNEMNEHILRKKMYLGHGANVRVV
jgi:hypothetical protein